MAMLVFDFGLSPGEVEHMSLDRMMWWVAAHNDLAKSRQR